MNLALESQSKRLHVIDLLRGLILLALFSRLSADFSKGFLQTLGQTSMFSYITHLYLLHAMSWLLIPVLGYRFAEMTYGETHC